MDFKFFFALPTIVITLSLSQCKRIADTNLFITGRSMKNSHNHFASLVIVSSATSSTSIVDFVRIVYLRDLQEIATPPIVNMSPLLALNLSASEIQFMSLYSSSTSGYLV
jgi:hypothetical protein